MALPQRAMMEMIENNPKVANRHHPLPVPRLRDTDQRLEAIALHRIEVRLARLMLSALKLQSAGGQRRARPRSISACRRASWPC